MDGAGPEAEWLQDWLLCWRKNRFGYRTCLDLLVLMTELKSGLTIIGGEDEWTIQSLAGKAPVQGRKTNTLKEYPVLWRLRKSGG